MPQTPRPFGTSGVPHASPAQAGAWPSMQPSPTPWGHPGAANAGAFGAAPDVFNSTQQALLATVMMRMLEQQETGENATGAGRALRRMHRLRERVQMQPEAIVNEYWREAMEAVGAQAGDVFQPWHFTNRISWGRFKSLQRVHWHLSHILQLQISGRERSAAAYTVQLCRAVHQSALDQGGWEVAGLLLPEQDPLDRNRFGGSPVELEAIAAYREALRKLQKRDNMKDDDESADPKSDSKKKGGGKGCDGA